MSKGSRIAIGLVAAISAIGFWMTARNPPEHLPNGAMEFYGMTVLAITIAIACFFPKTHPVTLRIIGTSIFVGYVAYVVDSFQTRELIRAIVGLILWGIPSGYLAIMGTYPDWGWGSEGFNATKNKKDSK